MLVVILSLGELVQMMQSVTGSIILATARHEALAWMTLIEGAVSVIVIALVAKRIGLIGVCLGHELRSVIFSGVGTPILGCRVTRVGVARYAARAISPAVGAAIIPVSLLVNVRMWNAPPSWPTLLLYSADYSLTYATSCWLVLRPAIVGHPLADLTAALFQS